MPATKTVFVHVGCRKTGTSHLQLGLQRSTRQLARRGLHLPLGGRGGTMQGLLLPLQAAADGDVAAGKAAVAELAGKVRDSEHPRHLVTLEALAELPAEATSLLVTGLAEFDTRLVITARSWAHTIPSEWQQRVKSRYTGDFVEYADAVRSAGDSSPDLAAEADAFRRRQDVADIARRWRAGDPALPVTVILVPATDSTGPSLAEMFCELVSVAPDELRFPGRVINESLSHADAELLRRVNLALGGRLANLRGNYRTHVRKWMVGGNLMKRPRSKVRLPAALEAWCEAESARQLAELRELDCTVVGDPEGYLHPRLPGEDFVPATDDELVENAAGLLADLAASHAREAREWKRELRSARRQADRRSRRPGGRLGRRLAARLRAGSR